MDTRRTMILAAGVLVLACSGQGLDVGSNRDPANLGGKGGSGGSGGSAGAQTNQVPLPTWPDAGACAMPGNLPIAGVWEGRMPAISNLLPDDTPVRVTIGGTLETGPCGNVVYGEGSTPPPATDPEARYPSAEFDYPGPLFIGPESDGFGGGPSQWGPMPGNPYSILEASTESSRVQFKTALNELWKGWCVLQTPLEAGVPDTNYACAYNGGRMGSDVCFHNNPKTGLGEPIGCFKFSACQGNLICTCNANECAANEGYSTDFDLQFAGDQAYGTLITIWGNRVEISLQRVE